MKTGDTVSDLALYDTECCSSEVIFDTGDTFGKCPQCGHLCFWEMEEEIETADDLERLNRAAA